MRYFLLPLFAAALFSVCPAQADSTNKNIIPDAKRDEDYKQYRSRNQALFKIKDSGAPDALDKFVAGARALIKDYPNFANGYQDLMMAVEDYTWLHQPDKARALAQEMAGSATPEKYKHFKLWAKGWLYRLDNLGKPVTLKFVAVDGREVDLAALKGKVVLVDFWGTHCGPCVAELPRVKAALDKFHSQGFEVIGISCDTDKTDLTKYVAEKKISWPQYFDGKQQSDNKFTVAFGVDGIPHMFLVDRKGCLRVDNVRATDGFEKQIAGLLAEK